MKNIISIYSEPVYESVFQENYDKKISYVFLMRTLYRLLFGGRGNGRVVRT